MFQSKKANALRVVELFAGVGGFRQGLQAVRDESGNSCFEVVWSNQYEPKTKVQHAAAVYRARWGEEGFVNRDINEVLDDEAEMARLIAHSPDMLVGGFPCQDYSVAKPLHKSAGLEGKKGVLWWSITRMLERLNAVGKPVSYLLLENVDRLIASPAACRGRDFAVILASLQRLGYAVEWRVLNAADYGFAQRRRRTFIMAYHASTPQYRDLARCVGAGDAGSWMTSAGTLGRAFPASQSKAAPDQFAVPADPYEAQGIYEDYARKKTRFMKSGVCVGGAVWTAQPGPVTLDDFTRYVGQKAPMTLGDVIRETVDVPEKFYITETTLGKWREKKGAKAKPANKGGTSRGYSEGAVPFPDPLDRAARTIITSEGSSTASRTTHVVAQADGRLRRLVPDELEALNGFPRGFTDAPKVSDCQRGFMMGNALVTGIVTAIGRSLVLEETCSPNVQHWEPVLRPAKNEPSIADRKPHRRSTTAKQPTAVCSLQNDYPSPSHSIGPLRTLWRACVGRVSGLLSTGLPGLRL